MIRFGVAADFHIGIQKDGIIDPKLNISSRIIETFDAIDYMIDYLIKNKIDLFFIPGDIFHHSNPSIYYENMLIQRLLKLEDNKIKTYIILGNHDLSKIDNRKHALLSIQSYPWKYINIITEANEKYNLVIDDYEFSFIPWGQTPTFKDESKKKVFVGHFHMTGAVAGAEKLLIPETDVLYKKVKNIYFYILGHIHTHQIFQNVLYPGSLTRISLSEKNEEKGFYIVEDFKEFNFISIPNILNYKIINITDDNSTWNFKDLTKQDIVRIRVKSSFSNKELYSQLLSELIDKVHNFDIEIDYDKKVINNKELITGLSPKQAFLQYLDLHQDQIDYFEDVKIKGLEFLDEVLEKNET